MCSSFHVSFQTPFDIRLQSRRWCGILQRHELDREEFEGDYYDADPLFPPEFEASEVPQQQPAAGTLLSSVKAWMAELQNVKSELVAQPRASAASDQEASVHQHQHQQHVQTHDSKFVVHHPHAHSARVGAGRTRGSLLQRGSASIGGSVPAASASQSARNLGAHLMASMNAAAELHETEVGGGYMLPSAMGAIPTRATLGFRVGSRRESGAVISSATGSAGPSAPGNPSHADSGVRIGLTAGEFFLVSRFAAKTKGRSEERSVVGPERKISLLSLPRGDRSGRRASGSRRQRASGAAGRSTSTSIIGSI
jgi:hypothetical protein